MALFLTGSPSGGSLLRIVATHSVTELLLRLHKSSRTPPTTKPTATSEINENSTVFDLISVSTIEHRSANANEIRAIEIVKYIESGEPFSIMVNSLSEISKIVRLSRRARRIAGANSLKGLSVGNIAHAPMVRTDACTVPVKPPRSTTRCHLPGRGGFR